MLMMLLICEIYTMQQDRRSTVLQAEPRKGGRCTHPWQPARLIGGNSVCVGQCGQAEPREHTCRSNGVMLLLVLLLASE